MAETERVIGKVAFEEHFATPELLPYIHGARAWEDDVWGPIIRRLQDFSERVERMDDLGIDMAVLSLGSEGIQGVLDKGEAVEAAAAANEALATIVKGNPTRFAGFAAVPMQDPEAAAKELARAVNDLGLKGALVNGYTNLGDQNTGIYYDGPEFEQFWQAAADLGAPIYIHPRTALPDQRRMYEGREELLGAAWGFAVETGTHALRLISSGLFDRVPGAQVILGHLGEFVPFAIGRTEQRFDNTPTMQLEKPPTQVLRDNFYVTTSGNNHRPSLNGVIEAMGAERVLFATDYPFERMEDGARWFDEQDLDPADKKLIAHGNAERLLGVEVEAAHA